MGKGACINLRNRVVQESRTKVLQYFCAPAANLASAHVFSVMALFGLLLIFAAVASGEPGLRGEATSCIPSQGSCNPVTDRCCQGPGLMTCRLRPSTAKGDVGPAYACGEEFPKETNTKCAAEGQECSTDDHCCNIDPTLKVSCKRFGLKRKVCTAKKNELTVERCLAEGESCNPLVNGCCQEGPQGASLSCI